VAPDVRRECATKLASLLAAPMEDVLRETIENLLQSMDGELFDPECIDRLGMNGRLQKALSAQVHDTMLRFGFQKHPSDDCYRVPYSECISDSVAAGLADGSMDIADVCNAGLVQRMLDSRTMQTALNTLNIPYHALTPIQARAVNSTYYNVNAEKMKGDNARFVPWRVFWDVACAPTAHDGRDNQYRFDLVTAIMCMRIAGMKPYVPDMETFVFYEHPDNTMGQRLSRFQYSGLMFTIAKKICEAWNAMVYNANGAPRSNTSGYDRVSRMFFSDDDAKTAVALIAMAYKCQPKRTAQLADIMFGEQAPNCSQPRKANVHRYRRNVFGMAASRTEDPTTEKNERLAAMGLRAPKDHRQYAVDKSVMFSSADVDGVTANGAITSEMKEENDRNCPSIQGFDIALADPSKFAWEHPRDVFHHHTYTASTTHYVCKNPENSDEKKRVFVVKENEVKGKGKGSKGKRDNFRNKGKGKSWEDRKTPYKHHNA
jgi:hypothetical protein